MQSANTAFWIAAARARETARADRLFEDPLADLLAGEIGYTMLDRQPENTFLPVRTRFFDDVLLAARWARQIVLLGAGMDTRAYRLALPAHTVVYEIDQPGSLTAKDEILSGAGATPVCDRRTVEVDLRDDWPAALRDSGFEPRQPTVWLAEGLLFYLDSSTVDSLLTRAAGLSPAGAEFAADVFGTGLLRLDSMADRRPFCTDEPAELLRRGGWPSCTLTEPGQSRANYGRLRVVPDDWAGGQDPTMRSYLVVGRRILRERAGSSSLVT